MVAPLVIAAGAQAVSGIMQYYASEKARGATAKRLKEIERMFDAIVPPDYDLKIWDDPKFAATVPEPAFNFDAITPEQYQQAGMLQFVQEATPTLVQATSQAKDGREAQLDALRRYREIAGGEFDPQLQQMLNDASAKARRDAQSSSANILQDANRRGSAGSGLAIQAQQQASADAMDQSSRDSMMAAAEGYRNRLNATASSAQLGGDIHASEMGTQARNAGIINDFNSRTATRKQGVNQYNQGVAQSVSDANVANRNKFKVDNVNRYNDLQGQQFDARRANRSDRMDVEERKNKLKQTMYQNLMDKARGKAGIMSTGIDYMRQDTSDRNQMIQGVGNAVAGGAMYYGKYGGEDDKDVMPEYQNRPMDDYDEGTTPGNYRRANSDRWRTA